MDEQKPDVKTNDSVKNKRLHYAGLATLIIGGTLLGSTMTYDFVSRHNLENCRTPSVMRYDSIHNKMDDLRVVKSNLDVLLYSPAFNDKGLPDVYSRVKGDVLYIDSSIARLQRDSVLLRDSPENDAYFSGLESLSSKTSPLMGIGALMVIFGFLGTSYSNPREKMIV